MTDQDKLIEEAAKVIAGMDWLTSMHLEKARAVLSLFEKAQGEPSDAQVEAALDEWCGASHALDPFLRMRAALIAARKAEQ